MRRASSRKLRHQEIGEPVAELAQPRRHPLALLRAGHLAELDQQLLRRVDLAEAVIAVLVLGEVLADEAEREQRTVARLPGIDERAARRRRKPDRGAASARRGRP